MKQAELTPEECLCVILYYAKKYDFPPEEVHRIIDERMAAEGVDELGEYLYRKTDFRHIFCAGEDRVELTKEGS